MADKALDIADREVRSIAAPLEMREDNGGTSLVGYASTFDQPYNLGAFCEVVDSGAFDRTLGTNPDVRLLVDHEGSPIARTKSGTMTLSTDTHGLRVEARNLDVENPKVRELLSALRRGDLDQMSFAFRVPPGGDSWSDDYSLRTLRNVELSGGDVSVVTYPANESTSVSLRSRAERAGACLFVSTLMAEVRAGATISAANMAKLSAILQTLAEVDGHLDSADVAIDSAQADLADLLGVPNPDPPDPADVQVNGRPLSLAQAIVARLSV